MPGLLFQFSAILFDPCAKNAKCFTLRGFCNGHAIEKLNPRKRIKKLASHIIGWLLSVCATAQVTDTVRFPPSTGYAGIPVNAKFQQVNSYNKTATVVVQNNSTDSNLFIFCGINGFSSILVHPLNLKIQGSYFDPIQRRFAQSEYNFVRLPIPAGRSMRIDIELRGLLMSPPDTVLAMYTQAGCYEYIRQAEISAASSRNMEVFYTGGISMLMLFFAFMFVQSRQRLYGLYGFYLFFQWLYGLLKLSSHTLIGYTLLHYPFIRLALVEPTVLAGIGAYMWFVTELLNLKSTRPEMYSGLRRTAIALWCFSIFYGIIFCAFPHYKLQNISFTGVRIFLIALNLYIMWLVITKIKTSVKYYYLAGNLLFLFFAILSGIKIRIGLFESGYLSRFTGTNYYMLGILSECLLFAFAIGLRIRELIMEKQLAGQRLIEQMQLTEKMMAETNQQLEIKVLERTAQIREQAKMIEEARLQEAKTAFDKQLAETRMTALRSRMNPHFLFNSLNSIKYFILKQENDSAAFYLTKFSRLLRLILDYSNAESITLQQELEALKIYLEIESLRFGDAFQYYIEVEESVDPAMTDIPPLLLQPFVENAIWHGLANSDRPDKVCSIQVSAVDGNIRMVVSDNGVGRAAAAIINENKPTRHNSYGIRITEEKVSLFNAVHKEKIAVEIKDLADAAGGAAGTDVVITCYLHENS